MTVHRKPTAERRHEIVDAAIKVIGERGLRGFTAAQLAREVGIKDGTIFRHFKDMDAIIWAMLERIEEQLGTLPQGIENPIERLQAFVASRLHAVAVNPGIQSILFSDQLAHALGAQGPQRVAALRDRGRAFIRASLNEALGKGLVRNDLDIEAAVLVITGTVMGFLFAAKDAALVAPVAEMQQRSWQTLRSWLVCEEVAHDA